MNPRKTLEKARNNPNDVRYTDPVGLAEALGYRHDRPQGSHRIYRHRLVPLHLNLQPRRDGKAKPYQVRRILADIDDFGLRLDD